MSKLFINGHEASIDETRLASFHGNSVFTTMRSKNKEPLLWRAHWQRLSSHAKYFAYALPEERRVLDLIMKELDVANENQKIRVLLNTRDFALTFEPYEAPQSNIYEGVHVRFSEQKLHPEFKSFKTGNSLPYQRAQAEAVHNGVFESFLCDADGHVVDGSRTSIMLFDGSSLLSLKGGLKGIMREEVLAFARREKIPTAAVFLRAAELKGQLMLTNCLIGVVPVGHERYPEVAKLVDFFRMDA